jgi:hypothetical protein
MNASLTSGVVFVAVWLVVVFAYCLFRACGGRLVDLLSCACFSGPCCSCWARGGRIYEDDIEYPFHNYPVYDPYARGQLPAVILVNNGGGGRGRDGSSSSDDDDERADESEEAARVRELESRDAEGRELAKGALLLRNRTQPDAKNDSGPVVL